MALTERGLAEESAGSMLVKLAKRIAKAALARSGYQVVRVVAERQRHRSPYAPSARSWNGCAAPAASSARGRSARSGLVPAADCARAEDSPSRVPCRRSSRYER
jgi:hypothetical protein